MDIEIDLPIRMPPKAQYEILLMKPEEFERELNEARREERERCAGIAESFCHCSEAYTGRDLIDPTCDCHDIAAAIREVDDE